MSIESQAEILPLLREAVSAFLYPLKTTREVRKAASARLYEVTADATRLCKSDELLSKALLAEIFITIRAIEPEVDYVAVGDRADLLALHDKLDGLFYLLMQGETPEDRVPGVPRFI